ncbi:TonB-dependent receptor plug domain-containing protein [Silvimonas terrae]|uniref:TonB-dependent receptor plug domain-containing protein n=1 Tax=Silvimonas terrae TaxID=300266 RepID=UPI0027E51401|nr:TonB-dependent receptor plug domain-containing protein [Silvimonas terrae]
MTVRGFEADEYLDGLRLPTVTYWSRPAWDPYLLERVEVIKGPDSVLYGQAGPGGIVNLVSKRPAADQQQEVYVTVGSYSQYQAGFDVGGKIDQQGQWLYRITGSGNTQDTQVVFEHAIDHDLRELHCNINASLLHIEIDERLARREARSYRITKHGIGSLGYEGVTVLWVVLDHQIEPGERRLQRLHVPDPSTTVDLSTD